MSRVSRQEPKACPRAWEVEAARDGRLQPKDFESLERHVVGCVACQSHRRRLDALSEVLTSLPPVPDDVLAARRMRHQLLSELDRGIFAEPLRGQQVRRWIGGAVAVAMLGAVALLVVRSRAGRSSHPAAVARFDAPAAANGVKVDVTAETGAVWRKLQLDDGLRLDLDAGEIGASIGKRRPGQRVYIRLPDGEIDDLGTVLSVRVEQSHTTSVRVSEGRVRLRLDGRAPIELGPGESWSSSRSPTLGDASEPTRAQAPEPTRAQAPEPTRAQAPEPTRAQTPPYASKPRAATRTAAEPQPLSQAPAPASAPPMSSTAAYQAREEDEAYLHIVTLAQQHRMDEARRAAKDYLLRFPNGFRREEVLGVATGQR